MAKTLSNEDENIKQQNKSLYIDQTFIITVNLCALLNIIIEDLLQVEEFPVLRNLYVTSNIF